MTVVELIKKLKKHNAEAEILVYSDAEGNSLHGLADAEGEGPCVYLYPDDQYLEDEDAIT